MEEQLQQKNSPMFARKDLLHLILPLVIESFLGMTIGFIGTIMVAFAGQEAVSSVSLVDNVNALILVFVAALATGGAIIIAQYLGQDRADKARDAAKQLLYTTFVTSAVLMAVVLARSRFLLSVLFGEIEPLVMDYAQSYFVITAISYPFVAILNSVSAVFRSMGISKTPMLVTLLMSVINIVCCAVLIYGYDMGVTGAAIAATVSRIVASAIILILIRNRRNIVFLRGIFRLHIDFKTIRTILKVGIPSGLDSGMFQLGRLIVQSLIATFGTVAIAANAVVGQIMNIVFIPGNAIHLAAITVVGQCVGAGDHNQAASYTKRLLVYNYVSMAVLCAAAILLRGQIIPVFNLSEEAVQLSYTVLFYTCIFTGLLHPLAFATPNALRASGDVGFTMIVSVVSMWLIRVCMSYILERTLHLGLMSVWCAMYSDWFVRGSIFYIRFLSGKWRTKKVV